MAIVRWDPWGESMRMARDLDRIFGRLGQQGGGGEGIAWMPKIDVKRSGDDVMVRAELPGLRPEDVDIELSDNVLTISGERKTEEQKENEGWLIRESSYGAFERSISIPEGVDPSAISANFNDGVLEVTVPKAFEASQPRRTKIEIGGQTRMQMGEGGQAGLQAGTMQGGQAGMSQGEQEYAQARGMSEQGMTEQDVERRRQERQYATGEVATGSNATEQGMTEQDVASRRSQTDQEREAEEREKAGVGGRSEGGWV